MLELRKEKKNFPEYILKYLLKNNNSYCIIYILDHSR